MRASLFTALLALSVSTLALPQQIRALEETVELLFSRDTSTAPALPINRFAETQTFAALLSLEEAKAKASKNSNSAALLGSDSILDSDQAAQDADFPSDSGSFPTCSNPRTRQEWDSFNSTAKQAYITAIKCLQSKPASSGKYPHARSRYEEIVALHQTMTPNIHGNEIFLLWHRYYLWTFEDILRTDCNYKYSVPWWNESKWSGKFASSSVFTSQWYGSINTGGKCVTNGQFANLSINIGPGAGNTLHCLARNNNDTQTANTNAAYVDACNNSNDFAGMSDCAEGAAHAWGHNGIGAVMQDVYASPSDPCFFLHHAFIDHNFRAWQLKKRSRLTTIDGFDYQGQPLTLDTLISMNGLRPTLKIRDVLNTQSTKLCYKYDS